eukprot:TRINITY_DN9195_c0_g1_i3.p1 TRINITY_DN9195_c0_g1~~TRINITY_DN9195_c0_g1_i3.p1  ORF type:complete len:202 (-),score=56.29 TRINITY_DN9195_c0_g1_i3:37-642(-)
MEYNVAIKEMVEQVKAAEEEFKKATEQIEQCKTAQKHMQELVLKVSHMGLIPINDYGFMPGKIKHTNELLVHLGDDYFVETSAHHAVSILDRRIEMLKEKKAKLQEQSVELKLKLNSVMTEQKENEEIDIIEPLDEDNNSSVNNGITEHKEIKSKEAQDKGAVEESKAVPFIPIVMEHTEKKEETQKRPKKMSKFMQQFRK